MALTDEQQRDLRQLAWGVCDESLAPPEFARLQRWIDEDADALAYYVEFLDLHSSLAWEVSSTRTDTVDQRPQPRSWRDRLGNVWESYKQPLPLSLTIAGVVLAVIMIGMYLIVPAARQRVASRSVDESSVARLTELHDVQWSEGQAKIERFSVLARGQRLELERGIVEIVYLEGTRVTFEGPGVFVVDGYGSGTVERGKAVSFVPAKAIGFAIHTPVASIVDLGTEFGVAVAPSGESEVLVYRGKVSFSSRADSSNVKILSTGQSVRITPAGNAVELAKRPEFVQDIRRIVAAPPESYTILIDFGDGELNDKRDDKISTLSPVPTLGGFWNVLGNPDPKFSISLLDTNSAATSVVILPFDLVEITRNTQDPGADAGWVDADARIDFFAIPANAQRSIVFMGFDPAQRYQIDVVAARQDGGPNRVANYLVQGAYADSTPNGNQFDAHANGWVNQEILHWSSIAPTVGGAISLTLSPDSTRSESYAYVNAIRIHKPSQQIDDAPSRPRSSAN